MATDWTTSIQMVAIRVGREIETRLDLTNVGTIDAEAIVLAGSVLVRIRGRRAAQRLAAIWREAALHKDRLPVQMGRPADRNTDEQCPAGLVIRIGPDAAMRQDLVPATPPRMAHLRIQVGPLVWLVTDRAAYTSMRGLWDRVESLL